MPYFTGQQVFGFHPNPDLDGRPAHQIDCGLEHEQIPYVGRMMKVQSVYGCGHRVAPDVPDGHDTRCGVDVFHDDSAVDAAVGVGVLGQHLDGHGQGGIRIRRAVHVVSVGLLRETVDLDGRFSRGAGGIAATAIVR